MTMTLNDMLNQQAYGPAGEHDHEWGAVKHSALAGTAHRKCQVAGCSWITLDLSDDCDCGDRECPECAVWYAEHDAWVASLDPADQARWT
jgi:hypothetical protein